MRILAFAIDSQSINSAVVDVDAAQVIGPIAHVDFAIDSPTPEAAEVPLARLWTAVSAAARQAAQPVEGIEGVGLSVFAPGLVLLDEKDQPAAPVWLPADRRARAAARQVQAEFGEELLAEIGCRPLPGVVSAVQFREMLVRDAYLIREVRRYLHLNSWLALHLTGEAAFDPVNASLSGVYGTLTTRASSPRWCEYFEVDAAWLPAVVPATMTVGTIRSAVAAELGVPAGLPLKLGSSDTSSLMRAANLKPGELLHVAGTTDLLATLNSKPRADARRLVYQSADGDGWVYETHNPVGSAALAWVRGLCFRDQSEEEFWKVTLPGALLRATRVTLDPPFLGGDRLELAAGRAALRDLTTATDRLDLLAAVAREYQRQHQRALAALGFEQQPRRVVLTGKDTTVARRLIAGYDAANVDPLNDGALRGVARLFQA